MAAGVAAIVVSLAVLLFAEELRELVSPRDPFGSTYPTVPPPAGARRDIWFWFLRLEENALFIFLGGLILAALGLYPFVSP